MFRRCAARKASAPRSTRVVPRGIGVVRHVFDIKPLLAPLGLGWAAHARGAPLWVGLLYLVPHALSAAILGAVYRRGRR